MRLPLCPEAWVLLLSAGGVDNDEAIAELLTGPCDWARLTRMAARERAATVLWARIVRVLGDVPGEAEPLRRLARVSEFRQAHLRARLLDALDALEARDLQPVLLKGAAMAATRYATFADRPMGDLDLLIAPERIPLAAAALLVDGWRWSADAERRTFYAHHHHIAPLEDDQGTRLELHTALFPDGHPFALGLDQLLAGAPDARWEGRTVRVLAPEHQLLHACLHFAWSHAMEGGAWTTFRDIDRLLGAGVVEWEKVPALCGGAGGALPCYWTLRLARTLSGVPVPEATLDALRPAVPTLAQAVLERHFALQLATGGRACPSMHLARALWHLGCVGLRRRHGGRPWDMGEAFTRAAPDHAHGPPRSARRRPPLHWWRYLAGEVH